MRTTSWLLALVLLAAVCLPLAAVDDFYLARYQEGRIAFQTGSAAEAADLLRIACFGFLDEPPLLSEGLVWLSLAQSKAGRTADLDATMRRFLEVEKRFGTFEKANLPAAVRTDFLALLTQRIPPEALVAIPTLAPFADTEEKKIGRLPPKERERALQARAQAEPRNPVWPTLLARLAEEQGQPKDAIRWATRALDLDERNIEALRVRARALFGQKEYPRALADLRKLPAATVEADGTLRGHLVVCLVEAKEWDPAREAAAGLPAVVASRPDVVAALAKVPPAAAALPAATPPPTEAVESQVTAAVPTPTAVPLDPRPAAPSPEEQKQMAVALLAKGDVRGAKAAAARAVGANPRDREARKLLLEAAGLSTDWKVAAAEAAALQPFKDGEEPSMFYAAVGLWETGKREEARALMERARPKIAPNAFVEYYTKLMLQ